MKSTLVLLALALVAVAGIGGYFMFLREDLGELQHQCARTAEAVQGGLGVRAGLRCTVQESSVAQLEMIHVQVTLHEVPKSLSSEDARTQIEALVRRSMRNVVSVGFDLKQLDGPKPAP